MDGERGGVKSVDAAFGADQHQIERADVAEVRSGRVRWVGVNVHVDRRPADDIELAYEQSGRVDVERVVACAGCAGDVGDLHGVGYGVPGDVAVDRLQSRAVTRGVSAPRGHRQRTDDHTGASQRAAAGDVDVGVHLAVVGELPRKHQI